MRLIIKQKFFPGLINFQSGMKPVKINIIVEGELFSWGKKLHVMDASGNEAAFIAAGGMEL